MFDRNCQLIGFTKTVACSSKDADSPIGHAEDGNALDTALPNLGVPGSSAKLDEAVERRRTTYFILIFYQVGRRLSLYERLL